MWSVDTVGPVFMFNAVVVVLYNARTICVILRAKMQQRSPPKVVPWAGEERGSGAAVIHILITTLEIYKVQLLMVSWGLYRVAG